MEYTIQGPNHPYFMVVGLGGTGGFVAEGLCRLLVDKKTTIYLVDHDKVEERNIGRQNFYPGDLGRFKARVLAERLARQFDREIHYIVNPIEHLPLEDRSEITIGCVDNPSARNRLQFAGTRTMMGGRYSYQRIGGWYIDAGNSENTGQVLIGNSLLKELNQSFLPNHVGGPQCVKLPLPTIQQPALLAPVTKEPDCAEAVTAEEQSPVINRMMSDLVLIFVHKLINQKLSWMGAYINLDTGVLSTVNADPEIVSRITGHTVRQLEYRPGRRRRGFMDSKRKKPR